MLIKNSLHLCLDNKRIHYDTRTSKIKNSTGGLFGKTLAHFPPARRNSDMETANPDIPEVSRRYADFGTLDGHLHQIRISFFQGIIISRHYYRNDPLAAYRPASLGGHLKAKRGSVEQELTYIFHLSKDETSRSRLNAIFYPCQHKIYCHAYQPSFLRHPDD